MSKDNVTQEEFDLDASLNCIKIYAIKHRLPAAQVTAMFEIGIAAMYRLFDTESMEDASKRLSSVT